MNLPLLSWMWIVNGNIRSKYNISNSIQFFILVTYWFVLISLFPIGRHLHFSLRIWKQKIRRHLALLSTSWRCLGSLTCVFMLWKANMPFPIHIMKALSSLQKKSLHEENSRALPTFWIWRVKLRMLIAIYCPHSWSKWLIRMDSVLSA